jgi:glycine hydroxymethyltransferase
MTSILVVCTGNICRSPMATGFLRELLRERGASNIRIESAGVQGWEDSPPTPEAVRALEERGIDISDHMARRLSRSSVEDVSLVLAMAADHREAVQRVAPLASDRTFTLKEFVQLLDQVSTMGIADFDGGPPAERLELAIQAANHVRSLPDRRELTDEDVADPLGLGIEAFRAAAWELGELTERLANAVFGPAGQEEMAGEEPTDSARTEAASGPMAIAANNLWNESARGGEGVSSMKDYAASWDALKATDPEVAGAIASELQRERSTLRLIASENYASPAVLAALASTMNNKYAEGYPGRRYYGGCEFVDVTERLAIERAKVLFGADHANVQPHAGAQANLAVYGAFLTPNDPRQKVLGLTLSHGGHLTHGSPVNVSGKWFDFVPYEVDRETELIDMDRVRDLALEHLPRMILAGFTAYPRVIDFKAFREIADEVGALLMVDAAHFIGLVAGGAYPSPVPYADVVTFTTHKTLRGPRGAMILCREEHAKAIDKAVFPMMQGGPLEHVIAAKAVCLLEAQQPEFRAYAERTVRSARALAAGLAEEGLRVVSGGTDSHLALVDLQPLGMTGAEAELVCDEVGIALNKNAIPFDPLPALKTSGIRVGTPGPATLGMDEPEMKEVSSIIGEVLRRPQDDVVKERARQSVADIMDRFPVYPG